MANDDALLMDSTSYAPMVDFQLPEAAQPAQATAPAQQPPESEQGFWNQFYGSLGHTIFQGNPRLSGIAIEGLGRVSGSDSMKAFGRGIVTDFDESPSEQFIPRVTKIEDSEGLRDVMDWLGNSIGSGLGSIAMTAGGAAVGAGVGGGITGTAGAVAGAAAGGVGAIPGAFVAGFPGGVAGGMAGGAISGSFLLSYGDMYDYLVEQEGMDEDEAAHWALVPGTAMAIVDAAGFGKLATAPFKKELSEKMSERIVQLAAQGFVSEGATEGVQQLIQETAGELAEYYGYATEDIEAVDRISSILNASLSGGVTGKATGAASALKKPTKESTPEGDIEESGLEEGTESVIPDAPQTAADAGAPVEAMVEEIVEPEPAVEAEQVAEEVVEQTAEPETEAQPEPETEAEKLAEEEVQKEEDPAEPKSDLSLTSDGKFYSKAFKFLLNLPPGIGSDKPILDSQGRPMQEQEVDESGEPVFLESGKPKMGPVQTRRVYKVSDLYSEDKNGKARGALSKFPKGELELIGIHEYLIQKELDAPGEALQSEKARRQKHLEDSERELVEAAIQWTRDDFMSKLRNNLEFMQQLEEDGKSLEQYTLEFFLKYPMEIDGPVAAIGVLSTARNAEGEGYDSGDLQSLIKKYHRAKSVVSDPLDVSEFAGTEAEVTQDEISQYIADNQWRLDFGDVRRITADAKEALFKVSPELEAFEAQVDELKTTASTLEEHVSEPVTAVTWDQVSEKLAAAGHGPEQIELAYLDFQNNPRIFYDLFEEMPNEWAAAGILELNQYKKFIFQRDLLDQVISDPKAFYRHIKLQIRKDISEPAKDPVQRARIHESDPPQNIRDLDKSFEGLVFRVERAADPPVSSVRYRGRTRPYTEKDQRSSRLQILKRAKKIQSQAQSLYRSLGGWSREQELRSAIRGFLIDKDPVQKRHKAAVEEWEKGGRIGDRPQVESATTGLSSPRPGKTPPMTAIDTNQSHERFKELMSDWVKSHSIYSEQMPQRQKQLFVKEYQEILNLQKELAMIHGVGEIRNIAVIAENQLNQIEAFIKAEKSAPVRNLREAQARYKEAFKQSQEMRKIEEAGSILNVDYTVSGEAPQLDKMSFLGGNEFNKRQILIIDPSPEMRDYKAELQVATETEQQPGAEMEFEGVDYAGQSGHPQHLKNLFEKLYHAGHWHGDQERGTGVHIRVHDMSVMRDGKLVKILVVEEIQNDHAQYNRKQGSKISELRTYILENRLSIVENRRKEIVDFSKSAQNPNADSGSLVLVPSKTFPIRSSQRSFGDIETSEQLIDPALKDEFIALSKESAKIKGQLSISRRATEPQAVFQNTEEWTQLAMRKVFKIAMEEGYGGVAVIGGKSAGPITHMPIHEQNLSRLMKEVRDIQDTDSYEVDGLLSKTVDPVWNETKWSGVWADIMYTPARAQFSVNLNIDKLNQTIGLYDFLQEHKKESEYISGAEIKEFVLGQDLYVGSSAQKHYDENVAKQAKIVSGVKGTPAVGNDILRTTDGKPVFGDDRSQKNHLRMGSSGKEAYIRSPPKLWVFDEKMTKRLSGPQPIISPELKDIKGGWDRPLADLYKEATNERKEGVSYFEDMSGSDQLALKLRIQQAISGLPGLEYPITASLGKPGGPPVQVLGHMKGVTLNVQMPNGKMSKMPAMNLFVGNDRIVDVEPKYLLDPKKKRKIRIGHAESIRRAIEEGHDVPQESMAGHAEFDGGLGLEEDYEIDEGDAQDARLDWEEMGVDSPAFKSWSGGLKPSTLPSYSDARRLGATDVWRQYAIFSTAILEDKDAQGKEYFEGYERLKGQKQGSYVSIKEAIAYTPSVKVVYHSTPGIEGDDINFNSEDSFGFHAGTFKAAQDRRDATSDRYKSERPLKTHDIPGETVKGSHFQTYPAERVFFFKYDKLLPIMDIGGEKWTPMDILEYSIDSAERLREEAFVSDLKKYQERLRRKSSADGNHGHNHYADRVKFEDLRNLYEKHGFDGAIYSNAREDAGSLSIIAIRSGSLKLAADAPDLGQVQGKFDPTGLYGVGVGAATLPAAAALMGEDEEEPERADQ